MFRKSGINNEQQPAIERRADPRHSGSLDCAVTRKDGVSIAMRMTNLSRTGFCARSFLILPIGAKIGIRCAGGKRRAVVIWQKGPEIGCRFERSMSDEELVAMVRYAPAR